MRKFLRGICWDFLTLFEKGGRAAQSGEGGFSSRIKLYSEENHPTSPLGEATLFFKEGLECYLLYLAVKLALSSTF
jgi:hypothetical protein